MFLKKYNHISFKQLHLHTQSIKRNDCISQRRYLYGIAILDSKKSEVTVSGCACRLDIIHVTKLSFLACLPVEHSQFVVRCQCEEHTKYIRITCPFDLYPPTPHFYIVKLGFIGVCFSLIFALKHRLWVKLEPLQ